MIFGNRYGNSYGRSRGSLKIRLIIAAVLGGIALIGYFSKMDVNEQTGERQFVALTESQEIAMGLQAAPQMANEMGGAIDPNSSPAAARVAELGAKLVDGYVAAKSPYNGNFHFYLLNDTKTVNAFALPGGQIFITRALYSALENEAQLAGVLGHEIGHVIHRHAAQHMAKGQLGQGLVGAVAVGSGDQGAAGVANMVNQMFQLKYGRKDELQSDNWGLENMAAIGYDPREMVAVMKVLKAASGGASGGMFATHPNPDKRMEEIEEYVAKRWPDGVPKELGKGPPLN